MKMFLKVDDDYGLHPFDDDKAIAYIYNRKAGDVLECEVKQHRNYKFHRKLFALFKLVHDALPEPEPVMFKERLLQPEHTMDMTRKYLTVQAGFFDVIGTPNGEVRVEAKSLKFNKMKQEEFDELYSKVIDASLRVLPDTWSEEELNRVASEVISFA